MLVDFARNRSERPITWGLEFFNWLNISHLKSFALSNKIWPQSPCFARFIVCLVSISSISPALLSALPDISPPHRTAKTLHTYISHATTEHLDNRQDIALRSFFDRPNFPVLWFYHNFAVDGPNDWVSEQPALRQLYAQVLSSVDLEQQQAAIRQMERHNRDQAYFLFLYNPVQLYAMNKAVQFVPYVSPLLNLTETSVTDQHWSVRKQKAAVNE